MVQMIHFPNVLLGAMWIGFGLFTRKSMLLIQPMGFSVVYPDPFLYFYTDELESKA